jgi:hypothetical protein
MNFLKDLISSKSEYSSKRASAMFTLLNVIVLTYIATFRNNDHITPEFMFDALCLIAGGGLGLTVIEKIFDKKSTPKVEEKTNTTTKNLENDGDTNIG